MEKIKVKEKEEVNRKGRNPKRIFIENMVIQKRGNTEKNGDTSITKI